MIKAFATGRGGGFGPVEYLCSLNPFGRGLRIVPPQILKGDPGLMRQHIDAIPFEWKYTSGVVSFAAEDAPSGEQVTEFIDEFESLAFAGLPLSSRSILWVRHEHAGRAELHFVIPRQEVHSGKSFNAFPPGWEKKFDLLRDKFNFKYGWARPDDPRRARPVQPGVTALIDADCKRRGKEPSSDPKAAVTEKLIEQIEEGNISTRADVIQALRDMGYQLPRIGKDYITTLDPSDGKRNRLKGSLYTEDFSAATWLADWKDKKAIVDLHDPERAAQAEIALCTAIAIIAEYNKNRYQPPESAISAQSQPVVASVTTEYLKENDYDEAVHNARTATDPVLGRRARKNLAAAGRTRNHHAAHNPWHQGKSTKGILSTLYQYHSGTHCIGGTLATRKQPRNPENAPHQQRTPVLLGASGKGECIHGGYRQASGRVSERSDSPVGTCFSGSGRTVGRQSQTQRRYDETHPRCYRGAENSARNAGKQGCHDVLSASGPGRLHRTVWKRRTVVFPCPRLTKTTNQKNLAADIAARVEALADRLMLDALGSAAQLRGWRAGFALVAPVRQPDILEDTISRQAAALAGHLTVAVLAGQMQSRQWNLPILERLPLPVNANPVRERIEAQAQLLAARTIVGHLGHALQREQWQGMLATVLQRLSSDRESCLVKLCLEKSGNLCAARTMATIGESLARQGWRDLDRALSPMGEDSSLVTRIVDIAQQEATRMVMGHAAQALSRAAWLHMIQPNPRGLSGVTGEVTTHCTVKSAVSEELCIRTAIAEKSASLAGQTVIQAVGMILFARHKARLERQRRAEIKKRAQAKDRLYGQFWQWRQEYDQGSLTLPGLAKRCANEPELRQAFMQFYKHLEELERERLYWEAFAKQDLAQSMAEGGGAPVEQPQADEGDAENCAEPSATPTSKQRQAARKAKPNSGPRFAP